VQILYRGIEVQFRGMKDPLFRIGERRIESGARLLIRGPSGTGKTTLLHITAGLLDPHKGSVAIDGKEISSLSEGERCRWRRTTAGLVFQKLNLLGHLTALENVLLGSPAGETTKEKAREALTKLGIDDLANQLAYHLSLGEQQRVAVARVIARSPRLILADEPTSSLDARNAELVMQTLFQSTGKDGTLVVATHDERVLTRFRDIWNLEGGEIR